MKTLLNILGVGLTLAGLTFLVYTALVLLFSFADWAWVGYHWPLVRLLCGFAFIVGVVGTTLSVLDER